MALLLVSRTPLLSILVLVVVAVVMQAIFGLVEESRHGEYGEGACGRYQVDNR